MYGATGTACSTRLQFTSPATTSTSAYLSCSRHLPGIPGLYPNFSGRKSQKSSTLNFTAVQQKQKARAGCCRLLTTPCIFLRSSSCRRTPISLPSLVPTPVLRKRIAQKLRSVNEPYVTQPISNERNGDEPEVLHNGSSAVQLSEEGSPPEVECLAPC